MIGYSGTGFKGMQISPSEETIEGELFKAFVKAGAIGKANADDPRKASLVRCARTDKNVHAAGNMISLKLIVEDPDIVEKINENLHPQIRVWGIERTIGSFSCYQACDSRWYEYLIPTLAFLPPHPSSWLAKNLERIADEAGDREGYESRQADVRDFWPKVEEEQIKAILETIDEDIRWDVVKALQGEEEASAKAVKPDADVEESAKAGASAKVTEAQANEVKEEKSEVKEEMPEIKEEKPEVKEQKTEIKEEMPEVKDEKPDVEMTGTTEQSVKTEGAEAAAPIDKEHQDRVQRLRAATKAVRAAYNAAKRRYRITEARIDRVQQALNNYLGTKNYHNYTIQKAFKDPSANRHIKSFVVNRKPILIGDGPEEDKTEWLSLKVHGQSFMMHQIRKMIGMVTLLVRSGSDIDKTMAHSFTSAKYSIPKVPGLGLMLERPVFDSYNTMQASKHEREPLRFDKYDDKIEEFKHREIYGRMFAEEQQKGEFGRFFNHVDNFREPYFLYVSSKGLEATEGWGRKEGYGEVKMEAESDNEGGAGEA
jgi:tRNA pseudouridine38-40 synthase